jgi:AbrB family looped-hinge helix DNA binding protein
MSLCYNYVMEHTTRTRVSENGRVVIPASFRKALGIEIGDEVVLELKQGELRITTQQQRIQRARERARKYLPKGVSLSKELLAERREAAGHE